MRPSLHKEIADHLRERITSGAYRPGERLPTEPDLEAEFNVSRNTVRLAISALEHEGLIELRHGHGMFVPEGPLPFMVLLSREEGGESSPADLDSYRSGVRAAGRRPGIRNFEARIEYPSREVAGWLEIDENSQVVVRGSRRFIDERPYSLQRSYYPMDLVRGTEIEGREKISRGAIRVLAELGHPQSGYRDEIVARMPTPEERAFFKLRPGVPVIVVHRTAYSEAERPVRLTVTTYAADRNRPCYEIGEIPELRIPRGQISIVG